METKDIIAGYKAWRANGANEISLTPEQVYTLLWNWPCFHPENHETGYGWGDMRPMGEFFNALALPGVLKELEPKAPAKPAYLPIKRKVRWADLEDGCVLRYCGNDFFKHHQDRGMLIVGNLYTIRKDVWGRITIPYTTPNTSGTGVDAGEWASPGAAGPDPWEFVSNPNYVHGFRIGETVWSTGGGSGRWGSSTGYGPYTVKGASSYYPNGVTISLGGTYPANYLTRDPTKAYGYKAPVEYKVKDGVAKEGDVIWWLFDFGDPEKVTIDDGHCQTHASNIRAYPESYQLREPQKVWDYKNK